MNFYCNVENRLVCASETKAAKNLVDVETRIGKRAAGGHKRLENAENYTHRISFESEEWNVATVKCPEEESKLLEARFWYVRSSDRDEVATYRKRRLVD